MLRLRNLPSPHQLRLRTVLRLRNLPPQRLLRFQRNLLLNPPRMRLSLRDSPLTVRSKRDITVSFRRNTRQRLRLNRNLRVQRAVLSGDGSGAISSARWQHLPHLPATRHHLRRLPMHQWYLRWI